MKMTHHVKGFPLCFEEPVQDRAQAMRIIRNSYLLAKMFGTSLEKYNEENMFILNDERLILTDEYLRNFKLEPEVMPKKNEKN